ncbi:MAG: hypothetical protein K8F25_19275 [Fimbriimonadaceae bacterium]|nr:hypothetical protein [Alphaproteobacteria bacterium]
MRQLWYAWILAVMVGVSPISVSADSNLQIAPLEGHESASAIILRRYLANNRQQVSSNMTPFESREIYRGAECPSGSGRYCSNALPYCCRSADGSVYCAPNTGGCTR